MDAVVLTFSRPETTDAVTRGAARLLINLGYAPLREVGLPSGRRADILALGPRGDIFIVDLEGHQQDPAVQRALEEAARVSASHKILGSFPRALEVVSGLQVSPSSDALERR